LNAKDAEQYLRFAETVLGRTLEPSGSFRSAGRYAGAREVAPRHAVLGVGYSGSRCMGKEREGLLTPASLAQSDRASQARRWRCEANDSIYDTHLLQTQV
jgi:hypothetical protein